MRAILGAAASTAENPDALDQFGADEALLLHGQDSLFGFATVSVRQAEEHVNKLLLRNLNKY